MKYIKPAFLLITVFVVCSSFLFRQYKPVYAFGVSTSFSDTLVYYTEIQLLDSVFLDGNKFLPYRDHYSYQLKNYLEYEKGLKNRTCMIFFSTNPKKIHKEYSKIVGRYIKNKNIKTQELKKEEFAFTKPDY